MLTMARQYRFYLDCTPFGDKLNVLARPSARILRSLLAAEKMHSGKPGGWRIC
jgi:hypothetical protein